MIAILKLECVNITVFLFFLFILETITALFKTRFRIDFPFDVQEFVAFGFIGYDLSVYHDIGFARKFYLKLSMFCEGWSFL